MVTRPRRAINPVVLALGGLVLLLLLLWLFAATRNSDQDKLGGNIASANGAAGADPDKLCASKATYALIKRQLFRQAAQVRGSDQAAYDRLAAYAVVRMENPVMESEDSSTHAVNCSGSLALDLPPNVAVVGGRRSLMSDIDYTVQPAADGSGNVVLLRNADAIISPLATLARVSQPVAAPAASPAPGDISPTPSDSGAVVSAPPPAPAAPRPASPPSPATAASDAHPSFNCANARTHGEIAVCRDSGLASLDRAMAGEFNSAMSRGDPGQRALLQQTRSRFLAYRDRCGSNACIADAYRGRMREISDIMAGRWRSH